MILLHAPSVYDFRDRGDVLFAYLSDSDSVNVTAIYEQYPLGFLSIRARLREAGMTAEIVNVAALMLRYPELDVRRLIGRLEAPVFGLDLHWMCHAHGTLALAEEVKAIHPESIVAVGGISATYYAEEVVRYPGVDVVVRGYDTLEPVTALVRAVRAGERDWRGIPNLVHRGQDGEVASTGFAHKPTRAFNDTAIDWGWYRVPERRTVVAPSIMTLPSAGCAYDCPWCGGSRYSMRRIMGTEDTLVLKEMELLKQELRSLGPAAEQTSIYALQCYSETPRRMEQFLTAVEELGYRSVHFEQFHLTRPSLLRRMAKATQAHIMLSPQSHDPLISRLAGRGTYSMEQMEEWIGMALDMGIRGIAIWFFIGMPQQTVASVLETVDYCRALMERFPGQAVLPLLCPMVPFLDPGSRFFEEPEVHGYRIFHRTLEEHRRAMVEPVWHRRLNYETRWMSRRELQAVTYQAIDRLVETKADLGVLPASLARPIRSCIVDTLELMGEIERSLDLDGTIHGALADRIRAYNRRILAYSGDQILPMERPFGGRWFDDFTIPPAWMEDLAGVAGPPAE